MRPFRILPILALLAWASPAGTTQREQPAGEEAAGAPSTLAAAAPGPAVLALRSELTGVIERGDWRGDRWSVLVVSLDRGDTLFAHEPGLALAPASNMKLFTTAAALYYLGPSFRYNTFLLATGPVEAGVLEGDLVVYGTGDPTLSGRFNESKTAVWEAFADTLAAAGVREVAGDLVGDGSYFAGSATGEGWKESYMNASYAAPAGALSFNDNVVTLRVLPAAQPGWRPEVQLVPGGRGMAIVNQATTAAGGRTNIRVDRAAYDGPVVISGRIARGGGDVWRSVPVPDPALYTAAVVREVLASRGIAIRGQARAVQTTSESPLTGRSAFAPAFRDGGEPLRLLAVHQSPPLLELLKVVNHESHNFYAEQVLRTVGRVALGAGTVEAGEKAVRYMLECETGDAGELRVYDGSGLSPLNRASAETLVRLLGYMAGSPMWEDYRWTLVEAGQRNLRRMGDSPAAGNLRAKTGTIEHVSALSGYVRAANGERLAFSIISNGVPSTWGAKRIEDAIGARLASFDRPVAQPALPEPAERHADSARPRTDSATAQAAAPEREERASEPRPAAARTHTIARGDTLEGIAKRYGVTLSELRAANPGLDPRRLIPGRTVKVPGG